MTLTSQEREYLQHVRTHLTSGCVLTPAEVDLECATLVDRPLMHDYALYAEMPMRCVELHESQLVPQSVRFTAFESPSRVMHGMVTLQSAGHQTRYVVSFAEEKARQWLRHAIANRQIVFAMNIVETNQLTVVRAPFVFNDVTRLLDLTESQPTLDDETKMSDATVMLSELIKPGSFGSSLPGFEVSNVHLVIGLDWFTRPIILPSTTVLSAPVMQMH